jgi:hypothetical protein
MDTQTSNTHPALHYDGGRAVVGIQSEKGMTTLIQRDPAGVTITPGSRDNCQPAPLPYPPLAHRWALTDVAQYKLDISKPSGGLPTWTSLVDGAREADAAYVQSIRPEEPNVVACWVVATYFHPLFLTFPRLNLMGEKGSGKSKRAAVISHIAHNGLLQLDPTPASLFRQIHPLAPTLCLDEMENLGSVDKDILRLINAGYKAGATVVRCEGEERTPTAFNAYCPMVLASISGLNDVTADRSITLVMRKGKDLAQINREVEPGHQGFAWIRHRAYRMALGGSKAVDAMRTTVQYPPWLSGRALELFRPLLTIASLVEGEGDPSVRKDVLAIAEDHVASQHPLSKDGWALFNILWDLLAAAESVKVYPSTLLPRMKLKLDSPYLKAEQVGRMLQRYQFKAGANDKTGKPYTITRALFTVKAEEHSFPMEPWPSPQPVSPVLHTEPAP